MSPSRLRSSTPCPRTVLGVRAAPGLLATLTLLVFYSFTGCLAVESTDSPVDITLIVNGSSIPVIVNGTVNSLFSPLQDSHYQLQASFDNAEFRISIPSTSILSSVTVPLRYHLVTEQVLVETSDGTITTGSESFATTSFGLIPSSGYGLLNASLVCTSNWLAVITWVINIEAVNVSQAALVPPLDPVTLTWTKKCKTPGCSATCAEHGTCDFKEATCHCNAPWVGYSCNMVFTIHDVDNFCPGHPLVADWEFGWSELSGTEWWSLTSPLTSGWGGTAWDYFLTYGNTTKGTLVNWSVYVPGTYRMRLFHDDWADDLAAIWWDTQSYQHCGIDNSCTSDADCSGTSHGTCVSGTNTCTCKDYYWWTDCSHGCGAGPVTFTNKTGSFRSDMGWDAAHPNRTGYLDYSLCTWIISPPVDDVNDPWDTIEITLPLCGIGRGDYVAFSDADDPKSTATQFTHDCVDGSTLLITNYTRVLVTFSADYSAVGEGFKVSWRTFLSPQPAPAKLPIGAIVGGSVGGGILFVAAFAVMLILWARSRARVAALESELERKWEDNTTGTPAEKAIKDLRKIQKKNWIRAKDKDAIGQIIGLIAANKLFKLEVGKKMGKLDGEVNAYLLTTFQESETGSNGSFRSSFHSNKPVSVLSVDRSSEMVALRAKLGLWDFDVRTVADEDPLPGLGMIMLEAKGVLSGLKLDQQKLKAFLCAIQEGYKDNPYHNKLHAADVAQAVFSLLESTPFPLTDIEVLAMILAALCHDYRHPGVNNSFVNSTLNPLAIRYNCISTLESMHCSESMSLLFSEGGEYNFMGNLGPDAVIEFHRLVSQLILSTDMAKHVELLGILNAKLSAQGTLDPGKKPDRLLFMQVVLKFSDLSNSSRKWDMCRFWADKVMEEFYMQGDKEKARKMQVSAFMDRETTDQTKCQLAFIQYICQPMAEMLIRLIPDVTSEILENLAANKAKWTEMRHSRTHLSLAGQQ